MENSLLSSHPFGKFLGARFFIIPCVPRKKPPQELEELLPSGLVEAIRGRTRLLEEQVLHPLLLVRDEEEFRNVFYSSTHSLSAIMVAITIEVFSFFIEKPQELLKILEILKDLPSPSQRKWQLSREDKEMLTISEWNLKKGFLAVISLLKMLLNEEEIEEARVEEFFVLFLETLLSLFAISYRFSSRKRPRWKGLLPALCERAYLSSRRMGGLALQLGLLKVSSGARADSVQ